ncbi:fimbrial protein [Providencia huaxiensis]|uniref:fimbrial protein n=1 Tax=Providencia huaxiensis TaxID=2027290 RepID=UPI00375786C0
MKKYSILFVFYLLFLSCAMAATYEFQRPITVKVMLTNSPCYISPDPLTVEFNNVQVNQLYSSGVSLPFTIHLIGCDTTSTDGIKLTFLGNESDELPGFLKIPDSLGGSKGFAVGITNDKNEKININQTGEKIPLQSDDNFIDFIAHLKGEPTHIQNKTIQLGEFFTTSTMVVSYE